MWDGVWWFCPCVVDVWAHHEEGGREGDILERGILESSLFELMMGLVGFSIWYQRTPTWLWSTLMHVPMLERGNCKECIVWINEQPCGVSVSDVRGPCFHVECSKCMWSPWDTWKEGEICEWGDSKNVIVMCSHVIKGLLAPLFSCVHICMYIIMSTAACKYSHAQYCVLHVQWVCNECVMNTVHTWPLPQEFNNMCMCIPVLISVCTGNSVLLYTLGTGYEIWLVYETQMVWVVHLFLLLYQPHLR